MKHICFLLSLVLLAGVANAQQSYTVEQAVAECLKHHYGIMMAVNDSAMAENNHSAGMAGMLPTVTASGSAYKSSSNLNQKFSTGLELNKKGVAATNYTGTIGLGWTVFDGMKMFITYDKLGKLREQSVVQLHQTMDNAASEAIAAWYGVARAKEQITVSRSLQTVYEERLSIAEKRLELGNGNKADLLQARIDYNEIKVSIVRLQLQLRQSKRELALAMGIEQDSADITGLPGETDMKETAETYLSRLERNNTSLLLSKNAIELGNLQLREAKSYLFPTVKLGVNYNFNRNSSQAGFALYNQTQGLSYGLNVNYNLFNGGIMKRAIQNQKLILENSRFQYELEKQRQKKAMEQALDRLRTALNWLNTEEQNKEMAEENVAIMLERFRLAECSSLELKDAQQTLAGVSFQLAEARYEASLAKTELLRIDGSLLR